MKHKMNYNGEVSEGYADFTCPTCERHVRIPVDGGMPIVLNYGDANALHNGATPGLSMSVSVTQKDYLEPFEDYFSG